MEVSVMSIKGGYGSKTSMEIRWAISRSRRRKLPIYISTNPTDINPVELRELYTTCNHSCHRFPNLDRHGKLVDAIDLNKLGLAISHSSLLVSVFCNLQDVVDEPPPSPLMGLGDILRGLSPFDPLVSPSHSQLVGFGRAVSDFGLTASIYDVMVAPSLRGMGIGRMIVNKIVRVLTKRDIYDISALCSANERLFFKACGFGDDMLGSTTMMYARTVSGSTYPGGGDQIVRLAGSRLLLAPAPRKTFGTSTL